MNEEELLTHLPPVYFTYYTIESSLNYGEPFRYCQRIEGEIKIDNNKDFDKEAELITIGKVTAYKLLISVAQENHIDAFDVFDAHQFTLNVGEEIYDFEAGDFADSINDYFSNNISGADVLILSRMEILPDYRGKGIGKRAVKDVYNNFSSGCGLFVLKYFPIQYEYAILSSEDPFTQAMGYEQLSIGKAKAIQKLAAYYKSMGFEAIPGIDPHLLMLNPSVQNQAFESIVLDQ